MTRLAFVFAALAAAAASPQAGDAARDDQVRAAVAKLVLRDWGATRETCVTVYVPGSGASHMEPASSSVAALVANAYPGYRTSCPELPGTRFFGVYVGSITWHEGAAHVGAGELAVGIEGRPGYRVTRNWRGRWIAKCVAPAE